MIKTKFTGFLIGLLLLLMGQGMIVKAQFSFSINYTVNDGLPSSKVFDVLQDSKGYIWFATENGVSRFNGYSFENFTVREGLPANSTLKLHEDREGRIWFLSYQGSISYYKSGQIHPSPANNSLIDLHIPFIAQIYVDDNETLWLSPFNGGLIWIDSIGGMKYVHVREPKKNSIILNVEIREHGYILSYFNLPGKQVAGQKETMKLGDSSYAYRLPFVPGENHFYFLQAKDHNYISFGKKLYLVEGETLLHKVSFEDEIVDLYQDSKGNVWLSEKFHGVHMYSGPLTEDPSLNFFHGQIVSGVLQDTEGNYWFATTENGVYFVPSLEIKNYNKQNLAVENDVILTLEINGNDLFFSTDHKEIYHANVDGNKLTNLKSLEAGSEFIDNVYSILADKDDNLYITGDYQATVTDSVMVYQKDKFTIHALEYGYKIIKACNGDILLCQPNGLRFFRDDHLLFQTPRDQFDVRVFSAAQAADSSWWLGTITGLVQFKDDQYVEISPDDPVLGNRITSVNQFGEELWVGSFSNGLAIRSEDSVYYLNEENGLNSNRIKSMCYINDSTVWVGTNRGLNRITFNREDPVLFDIRKLDIWDGLPSNEINEVKKLGQYIWLATDKGLVTFDPAIFDYETKLIPLVLDKIILDPDRELPMGEMVELKHNENSITFEFHGITFKHPRGTVYHYKLEGLNKAWNKTLNTSVRFHGLNPGDYTFYLRATNASGGASKMMEYSFSIRKHFAQTIGFIAAVIAVAFLLIFLILRNIIVANHKRAQLQRKIYLAEQKAMLSQMNPHFIFNSLNSIQNFILENDHVNANVYLVIFSSLIRKILDASKKNFISLKDEIDIIKLYLELEKFRFHDRFEYTLNIEQTVNPGTITIPSMILQPYLENAIWHGIMPKTGKGLIVLDVTRSKSGYLKISITDNGIGRKKAGEISRKRKHHKPTGMKNVEERLKLLNELNKTNMSVKIIDLVDEEGRGTGTKVEIYMEDQ